MRNIVISLVLINGAGAAFANEPSEEVKAGIKKLAPTAVVSSMDKTPIKGVSEIIISTGQQGGSGEVFYMSDDGEYLFNGNIIETSTKKDITDERKSGLRKEIIDKFSDNEKINFFPDEMKYKLTVFTDIDCGYCRKLHSQIDEYNKLGIGISYMFFPRSGINTPSFDKAVTVWCSDDQQSALTNAKSGISLETKQCDNPIKEQYLAGRAAGVTGTPALVLSNGKLLPGYLAPKDLLNRLMLLDAK